MMQNANYEDTIIPPCETLLSLEDLNVKKRAGGAIITTGTECYTCSATIGDLRRTLIQGGDVLEKFEDFLGSTALKDFANTMCGLQIESYQTASQYLKKWSSTTTTTTTPPVFDPLLLPFPSDLQQSSYSIETTNMEEQSTDTRFRFGSQNVRNGIHQILHDTSLCASRKLALVFHGTAPTNIKSIFREGLDPKKRRGQAYGVGEYFAKDPSVCVAYCKQGNSILAFAVLIPLRPDDMEMEEDPRGNSLRRRGIRVSDQFVVVPETCHQFPLGVLKFSQISKSAMTRSKMLKFELQRAYQRVEQNVTLTQDVQRKALIIQLLIQAKVDHAVEKYAQFQLRLSIAHKKEIAMYVDKLVDHDLIQFLFPGLPEPFAKEEFENLDTHSMEWHLQKTKRAKVDYDSTCNALASTTTADPSASSASSLSAFGSVCTKLVQRLSTTTKSRSPTGPETNNNNNSATNPPSGKPSNANDPEWQKQHTDKKQQRLLLLRHAAKCPHEEGCCPITPQCADMKRLWKHMAGCKNNQCRVPLCFTSRAVLSHYRKCKDAACTVCGPVRRHPGVDVVDPLFWESMYQADSNDGEKHDEGKQEDILEERQESNSITTDTATETITGLPSSASVESSPIVESSRPWFQPLLDTFRPAKKRKNKT